MASRAATVRTHGSGSSRVDTVRRAEECDAFYTATAKRVVSAVYAMTGDLAEAEDAVQEAYVRAWQRWGRLTGEGGGDDPRTTSPQHLVRTGAAPAARPSAASALPAQSAATTLTPRSPTLSTLRRHTPGCPWMSRSGTRTSRDPLGPSERP
ncbi:sigma factor [Streptomyces sp. NRRL B-1347]|uniref:sigma factor n=1 Tax=Streptomyces sp. NRRL B-1347 TaxID=1476877 RepID=UPI00099C8B05